MKKSKLFIGTGAFVLAIAGVFASKASKKFVPFTTAYASFSSGTITGLMTAHVGTALFTTATNLHPLSLRIFTGSTQIENVAILTQPGTGKQVYLK